MRTIKFVLVLALLLAGTNTFAKKVIVKKRNSKVVVVNHVPRKNVTYRKPVTKVTATRILPGKTVVVKHGGTTIHYNAGKYYRYNAGRYVWVTPPAGIRINTLPAGYVRFRVGNLPYFYAHGVYYINTANAYEVVEAPIKAVVASLPEESEKVEINGHTYYECYGTLYQVVRKPSGRAFQVVGQIEG